MVRAEDRDNNNFFFINHNSVNINTYRIADFLCSVSFEQSERNGAFLIPSFEPFRTDNDTAREEKLFALRVDDALHPVPKEKCERIRNVEGGNGDIIVDLIEGGGYQFIIKDISGNSCCLLQTNAAFSDCSCALRGNAGMRIYGLNNALMIVFAFASCGKDTILMHASTVRKDNRAYAFTANSGVGKSTHVSMWLGNIPGCDMINDDNPVVRVVDGKSWLYGTPWSGKTPCYRNTKAQLGAIVKVNRSQDNYVKPATTIEAFVTMLGASATMKWDSALFENICKSIKAIIEATPNYNLYCRPDREAAIICYNTIARGGN